jgi:spectinomycin phosphotransferase
MREPPRILDEHLRACLQDQYDLYPVTLEFLPRGKDYSAGVYRVVSTQGAAYLLKITSRPLYEPSCFVPRYLSNQGITAVVAPIPTKSNALWTKLMDWTVLVYPFHDGDTSLTTMTDELWREVGSIFKQIHQVTPPLEGFESLRKESFDPSGYARWVRTFESQHLHSREGESEAARALRDSWAAHQATIHMGVTTLEKLAERIKARSFPYVICHADLHAANLIRDPAGHVFVIDWDEVMLAPRERDFIFIRKPQADAFWQGYGAIEIDWMLLSYYLWERVVQDLIENAQNVCFKEDLTEATRAEIAQVFHYSLSQEGLNLKAAFEASAHLTL